VDPTGKIPGRGAYLHDRRSCWEHGLKGALAHALKVELTDLDRETLRAFMVTLPEETAPSTEELLSSEERGGEEQTMQVKTVASVTDREGFGTLGKTAL
jgi:predicted RNA-binding protein YlxR (DUF448 family)